MMLPIELARKFYTDKRFQRSFESDLRAYLLSERGCVLKTEDGFAMAHPVYVEDPKDPLFNWWEIDREWPTPANAWFVLFAIGKLEKLIAALPERLPWVCYHRKKMEWKCIPLERFELL